MSLMILLVVFLILIIVGWFMICYFIFYAWFEVGLNDGNDQNLNLASKYLWYASITSWITLSIMLIILIIGIIIGLILAIFALPIVLWVLEVIAELFLSIFLGAFKSKVPITTRVFVTLFFIISVGFICFTGYYALLAAYNINAGNYSSTAYSILKSLRYCYYTAAMSIMILVFIGIIIFAKIYLFIATRKEKKRLEASED